MLFGHSREVPIPSEACAVNAARLVRETLSGDCALHDPELTLLVVVTSGRARARSPRGEESVVGAGSVLLVPRGGTLPLRSGEELKLTRLCFDAERLLPARAAFEPLGSVDSALADLDSGL